MKKITLLFFSFCLIFCASSLAQENKAPILKRNSAWHLLSKKQQTVGLELVQGIMSSVKEQGLQMQKIGTEFYNIDIEATVSGHTQNNNLYIIIEVIYLDLSDQPNDVLVRYFNSCPESDSQEIKETIEFFSKKIIQLSIFSPQYSL